MDTLPNQVMRNDGANHGINQPGGNPVTPVIIMVPAPSSNKHSYAKNLPKHPMLELSLIQLLMAVLAIITQVIGLSTERPDAHYSGVGFWCGIFFGASGIFGILSSLKQSQAYIITLLVLSIIASVFCIPLLWISSIGAAMSAPSETYNYHDQHQSQEFSKLDNEYGQNLTEKLIEPKDNFTSYATNYDYSRYDGLKHAMFTAQIFISLIQAVTAIATSAMTCKAVCGCCKISSEDGMVYYSNNIQGNVSNPQNFQQCTQQQPGFITVPLTNIPSATQSNGTSASPLDTFIPTTSNSNNNSPPPDYEKIARMSRLQRFYSIDLEDKEDEPLGAKAPIPK